MFNGNIDTIMEDILVPIFVCVVLPVTIVWIVSHTKQQETNKKAEIMLKAIEAGVPVDLGQLQTQKQRKSIKQELLDKLSGACITSFMGTGFLVYGLIGEGEDFGSLATVAGAVLLAVGIALFVSFFVGKKMLAKEIEAEEKALEQK